MYSIHAYAYNRKALCGQIWSEFTPKKWSDSGQNFWSDLTTPGECGDKELTWRT